MRFLVDQLQQLCCKLFKKALLRLHTKRSLWERKRALFFDFFMNSIDDLWSALAFGHRASLAQNSSSSSKHHFVTINPIKLIFPCITPFFYWKLFRLVSRLQKSQYFPGVINLLSGNRCKNR